MIVPFLASLAQEADLPLLQLQFRRHVDQLCVQLRLRGHYDIRRLEEKALGMRASSIYPQWCLLLVLEPYGLLMPRTKLCLECLELELRHLTDLYLQEIGELSYLLASEHQE